MSIIKPEYIYIVNYLYYNDKDKEPESFLIKSYKKKDDAKNKKREIMLQYINNNGSELLLDVKYMKYFRLGDYTIKEKYINKYDLIKKLYKLLAINEKIKIIELELE
jgi:hypothetical protein